MANKEVLDFIDRFIDYDESKFETDVIRKKFRCGYCYYFANMLKLAFGRGNVCWAAPFSHVVWVDTDNTPYDIEGEYVGEALYFIPETFLKDISMTDKAINIIDCFKHTTLDVKLPTKSDIRTIIRKYCNLYKLKYDSEYVDFFLKR